MLRNFIVRCSHNSKRLRNTVLIKRFHILIFFCQFHFQYAAASQNGQTVYLPGMVGSTPARSHHVISVGGRSSPSGSSPTGSIDMMPRSSEDGARKHEIRLLKNREAARECRNKKKEYIKCLENRVAVLENQNKALIEELKSLKELYTGQKS